MGQVSSYISSTKIAWMNKLALPLAVKEDKLGYMVCITALGAHAHMAAADGVTELVEQFRWVGCIVHHVVNGGVHADQIMYYWRTCNLVRC